MDGHRAVRQLYEGWSVGIVHPVQNEGRTVVETLSYSTMVVADDELLSVDLGQERVLLDMETASYYGLDEVSTRVVMLLETPRSVGSLCAELQDEYEVSEDRCHSDVVGVLGEMLQKKIVRRVNNTSGPHAGAQT